MKDIQKNSYLQDAEVLEHTILETLLRQLPQLVDKRDHVLAHGRVLDTIRISVVGLISRVLRLHLFNHLVTKGAHLCRAAYGQRLWTFKSSNKQNDLFKNCFIIFDQQKNLKTYMFVTAYRELTFSSKL